MDAAGNAPAPRRAYAGVHAEARRLPRVVGHRGAAAHAPENTLASIRKAAALGARAVEIDVRLDGERRCVILHDATLRRTTDGRGRVARTPTDVLRALDAGRWLDPVFAGERVPFMHEALALARSLGLSIHLELKADIGLADATGRMVAGELLRLDARGVIAADSPRLVVCSFSKRCLAAARSVAPSVPRSLTVRRGGPKRWMMAARSLGATSLNVKHRLLAATKVAALHEVGLGVGAFTVNDPARAAELFRSGVDYVFSAAPDRILPVAPADNRSR